MLNPRAKDAGGGPILEENLARIQAQFGENSRAISTLAQLLQTPYGGHYRCPLRRHFLGSIQSGTRCAPIRVSKNSVRKRGVKYAQLKKRF